MTTLSRVPEQVHCTRSVLTPPLEYPCGFPAVMHLDAGELVFRSTVTGLARGQEGVVLRLRVSFGTGRFSGAERGAEGDPAEHRVIFVATQI